MSEETGQKPISFEMVPSFGGVISLEEGAYAVYGGGVIDILITERSDGYHIQYRDYVTMEKMADELKKFLTNSY